MGCLAGKCLGATGLADSAGEYSVFASLVALVLEPRRTWFPLWVTLSIVRVTVDLGMLATILMLRRLT